MVGGAYLVQFPDPGIQRFDVVFGRQVFEVARQVERVCVVRIERQQPRSPEEHGFDGPRRQPFAQDDLVGDAACQREIRLLVPAVAQRAEIEQVEGLVPVLGSLFPQGVDHAHLAFQPTEEQCRAYFAALQGAQPGEVPAAGVRPGPGLQPVQHPMLLFRAHVRTC